MASNDLMSLIEQAGFRGAAANTMYGIVMAESGGNATAHNTNASTGDNSYGLAQINMLGSMGPERLKEFGLTSADQLFDPLTNLKVAYKLSGGGADFTPWTTYTSGAYKNAAPGAVVTQSSATAGTGAPQETQQQVEEALMGSPLYGLASAVPEIKSIINQAIAGAWGPSKFENAVEATNWFKQNANSVRQMITLQNTDPAEYEQKMSLQRQLVQQEAAQLGVSLSAASINTLATNSLYDNWSSQTLQYQIGSYWKVHNTVGVQGGQAAATQAQLQQTASNYGIPLSRQALNSWTQNILSGTATADGFTAYAKQTAASLYPSLAQQINNGVDVKTIADPYVQTMASLLEIDPNTINFTTDPTIKKALQGQPQVPAQPTGATGSGIQLPQNKTTPPASTPLWQFEQQVKSDPRWQYTQNAHQATSGILQTLGQDWGFAS